MATNKGQFQKGHKINVGKKNHLGFKHSIETKLKIGLKSKGRIPWNKDEPWPEETKEKIRQTNKRKGIEPKIKFVGIGANHPNWKGGPPKCIDCGKQLVSYSAKRCFRCMHKGKLAYNWKGTLHSENYKIRNSIEYRLWREAVFARDNWTCQKYGIKGGKLRAHHIQNFAQYPELRFAIDNGITLSERAHREFHRRYGIKNNTQEQLNEYLNVEDN